MGGNWKRQLRRTAAWAAAFMFAVSSVCYGAEGTAAEQKTAWYQSKEHANLDFSQMAIESYQLEDMEAAVERLVGAAAVEGQEEEVLRQYAELLREVDRMDTAAALAEIAYSRDMSDETAAAERQRLQTLYPKAVERAVYGIQEALDTPYGAVLEEKMGKDYAGLIRNYEELKPRLLELHEQEQKLITEYDRASAEDYQVQVDQETWTYPRLENEVEPYSEQYYEVKTALDRQRNQAVGEIYLQLVQVRTEIATECGYDNYADYAYYAVYGRDFSPEEMERVRGDIREMIVPLMEDLWYTDVDYTPMYALESESGEVVLDAMEPYVDDINGELGEVGPFQRNQPTFF